MAAGEQTALISAYDKTGLVRFAGGLHDLGWNIVGSEGTARRLNAAGIPAKDIAGIVGGGPILDHMVVSLSREVHGGLLADDSPEHTADLEHEGIQRIGLVAVNMYPLAQEIADPNSTIESVRRKTDVGGPTMLHSAAKGRRIAVSDPSQYDAVLEWLQDGRPNNDLFILQLAAAAEKAAAEHLRLSAEYLGKQAVAAQAKLTGRSGELGQA